MSRSSSAAVVLMFLAFAITACSCRYFPPLVPTFRLASYYSSHMVLQRAPAAAVIWGFAPVDDTVTVTLSINNKTFTTRVNRRDTLTGEGVWSVILDPFPAFSNTSITAALASKNQTDITLDDVIFGDVYICSGQSNMLFQLSKVFNASEQFATAADYPNIRVMAVANLGSPTPLNDLNGTYETWQRSSNDSLGVHNKQKPVFSAVCWLYAKYIYNFVKTPLGLVQSNVGGTQIRSWSPPDVNKKCGEPGSSQTSDANSTEKWSKVENQTEKVKADGVVDSVLWNAMIRPLRNMTIFGVLWYQGENDAFSADLESKYNCMFPSMIDAWRREFSQASGQTNPNFPFGFVQLGPLHKKGVVGGFPIIRLAQTDYYGYAPNPRMQNVFMATAVDLTDYSSPYGSIHYRDKEDTALRLSYSGRAVAYGDQTVAYKYPYPTLLSADTQHINVTYGGMRHDDQLRVNASNGGFEGLCGDGQWKICPILGHAGNNVTLSGNGNGTCSEDSLPMKAVRYLWRGTPCDFKQCAVYSTINALPGTPFNMTIPSNRRFSK